ncbi:putative PAP-specific phosphatase, mitochondrial [Gracilariopsis chorda]|uniref:Putative PAP-specific phosphatase, mitochondrial n=1 Tax=Gracilariopsis chorda TaxID=448386 RepID=A0A2V3IQU0_9FLOR|nr:putative PAP-specific phosphatase, mitochondrial [Gracilariopsis chorda]|eukprot:PXF44482.1 putative PAP-specific phosphatase, mitochondrial [Gracilariopsis chorda]
MRSESFILAEEASLGFAICCFPSLDKERSFCLRTARRVDNICRRIPQLQTFMKSDESPVTAADIAIQATVFRELSNTFSEDLLVAEEDIADLVKNRPLFEAVQELVDFGLDNPFLANACKESLRWWTLDPIDGTKGLLSGSDFAVGLALIGTNERFGFPLLGTLMLPKQGVLLLADVLESKLEVIPIKELEQYGTSPKTEQNENECTAMESLPLKAKGLADDWHFSGGKHFSLPGRPSWTPLCCGSLVKYAAVAQGQAFALVQSLPNGTANSWDHAAGIAAVRASGGKVTDECGNDFAVGCLDNRDRLRLQPHSRAIVASARGMDHKELCKDVRQALEMRPL